MSQDSRRRAWEKKQQRLEAERLKRKELARAAQSSAVSLSMDTNPITPGASAKNEVVSADRDSSAKSKQGLPDRWRRSDVLLRVKNFIEKIRNGAS